MSVAHWTEPLDPDMREFLHGYALDEPEPGDRAAGAIYNQNWYCAACYAVFGVKM